MRLMLMLISGLKDMALGNCCDRNTSRTVVTNALSDAVLIVEDDLWVCIVSYRIQIGPVIDISNDSCYTLCCVGPIK